MENIILQTYNSGGLNSVTNTLYIENNKLYIDVVVFNGEEYEETKKIEVTERNEGTLKELKFILSDNFRII